jgi:uroporphyrinogen decarboxylase
MALVTDPEWCVDMFNTELDMCIAHLEMVLDKGYTVDSIRWPDDMGYKGNQFFSLDMYKELVKPVQQRAVEWAHSKGIYAHMHSCGDIRPFIPEFIDMGLDAINPLEVKAGVDPVKAKEEFGNDIVLHGGINAVLWDKPDKIKEEMTNVIPVVKKNGGYIFSSDHSIPDSVGMDDF